MTCRQNQTEANIYEVGKNWEGRSVLGAGCSCGWTHMTAYDDVHGTTAGQAEEYLRRLGYRPQPKGRSQRHARRNASTLLVFKRGW